MSLEETAGPTRTGTDLKRPITSLWAEVSGTDLRLLSLGLLTFAVMLHIGYADPRSAAPLAGAALLAIASLRRRSGPAHTAALVAATTLIVVSSALFEPFWVYVNPIELDVMLGLGLLAFCLARSEKQRVTVALLVATAHGLIVMTALRWGYERIDVFSVVQDSSGILLHGGNPFAHLYASGSDLRSIPYGPSIPLLAAPGRLLGDVRLMSLVATVVMGAALVVGAGRGAALSKSKTLLLCALLPLNAAMIRNAWVDIYALAGIALWWSARDRHRALAITALALAFGVKSYALLPLLLPFVWVPRARREIITATGIALAVTLGFVINSGLTIYINGLVDVSVGRFAAVSDSLSTFGFANLWASWRPALWIGVPCIFVVISLTCWRRPRDWGDLWCGAAVIGMAACFFGPPNGAYLNYWFYPATLLLLSIVGAELPLHTESTPPRKVIATAQRPA